VATPLNSQAKLQHHVRSWPTRGCSACSPDQGLRRCLVSTANADLGARRHLPPYLANRMIIGNWHQAATQPAAAALSVGRIDSLCRPRQHADGPQARHKLHGAAMARIAGSRSMQQARQLPSLSSSAPPGLTSLRPVLRKPAQQVSQGPQQQCSLQHCWLHRRMRHRS